MKISTSPETVRLVDVLRRDGIRGIVVSQGTRQTRVDVQRIAGGDFDLHASVDRLLGNMTFVLCERTPIFADVPDCRHVREDALLDLGVMQYSVGSETGRLFAACSGAYATHDRAAIGRALDFVARMASIARFFGFVRPSEFTEDRFDELVDLSAFMVRHPERFPGAAPHPVRQLKNMSGPHPALRPAA